MVVLVALIFLLPFMLLFYWLSVRSRKVYICPQCGERQTVEHMEASSCSTCGAFLVEDD